MRLFLIEAVKKRGYMHILCVGKGSSGRKCHTGRGRDMGVWDQKSLEDVGGL